MAKIVIPKPPKPGKAGGLGEKVEATVQRSLASLTESLYDWAVNVVADGLSFLLEVLEKAIAPRTRPIVNQILQTPGLPPEIRDFLGHLANPTSQADMVGLGGLASGAGMSAASAFLAPFMRMINYGVDTKVHTARADPPAMFQMLWRGVASEKDLDLCLKDLGWSNEFIAAWRAIAQPRPSIADLVRYANLLDKDLGDVEGEMRRRGFSNDDVAKTVQIFKMVPGPGDLISMAVREAFDDKIASQWGYDQDFPPEFATWMKRQGDKDGWAQKYWRAHWAMPGLTTALEAFHRLDDFDLQKLNTFLRVSDVAPAWRDIITKIAYNPLTRVDVRRMYGMGVLDRSAVVRSYLDLGYSPENAELLTQFTIKYEAGAEKELTKADILAAFSEGMLSHEEAIGYLNSIGYADNTAQFLISRKDAERARALTDKQIKSIRTLYINRDMSDAQARVALTTLGLAGLEIDLKLEEWRIDREAKVKRPTQAQLDMFLLDDIIDVNEYKSGLGALGLQDKYVGWYTTHVLADKADKAKKAEEAAREEQQRIRDRKIKSDYQVDKAELDVSISELRTAIAETQIARANREDRYKLELVVIRGLLPAKELRARAESDITGWEQGIADVRDAEALLREQIDALETQVADINLQLAKQTEELPARIEAAVTEEDYNRITADAARQELTWKREIRELELEKESIQDQIAGLETQITGLRAKIAERKTKLSQELALAEKAVSEIQLTAQYQADIETIEARLSEMRLNLSELLESKARLAVEYRKGLA